MKYYIIFNLAFFIFSSTVYSQSWNGRYMSIDGNYLLKIENEDLENKIIELEVLDKKELSINASFMAFFDKDIAVTHTLMDDEKCILKLAKSISGIFLSDYCEGGNFLTGFYEKSNLGTDWLDSILTFKNLPNL